MKNLTIMLLIFPSCSFAQTNPNGCYEAYYNYQVQLSGDMTFKFTWRFDLIFYWSKGTWTMNNDTIYFHAVPIYDTLSYGLVNGAVVDSLILSDDELSTRMRLEQNFNGLSSGGQKTSYFPEKLFFKKDRLYLIKNNRLDKKKQRGIWTKKKRPTWYFKCEQ